MRIVYSAFLVFLYGIYVDINTNRFYRILNNSISKSIPMTSPRIITLSQRNYERRIKFLNMIKRIDLEIAKHKSM